MENRFDLFVNLISDLNRNIRKIKTAELADYNLKGTQLMCLYYVNKFSKITAKELCDATGEDKSAISRALEYLENEGFIQNELDDGRKYKNPYALTQKGLEIVTHLGDEIDESIACAGEGLTDEDRDVMYRSLQIVNNNLKEICQKY